MAGLAQTRPRGLSRATLVVGAVVLVAALFGLRAGVSPPTASAQVACPPQPSGLSPLGAVSTRFTMLIRINTQQNVNAYTNFVGAAGGLGGHIRPQDVFMINTRFKGSGGAPPMSPTVAAELATELKAAFPCNRIIGLNGMTFDPASPGYAFSLIDHPGVFALMTDFEPMDWNEGRATAPGRPPWKQKYKKALKRIKAWMGLLKNTLASNPAWAGKRAGLVPIDVASWNYGEIAQAIDKKNRRLGGRHLGPQSVQTQDSCADGGPAGFAARYTKLKDQYRFKFIRKKVFRKGKKRKVTIRRKLKKKARPSRANLAVQVSFSHNPTGGGMAITKTSASKADSCVSSGLAGGAGAFFFFASHEAMAQLVQQPTVASLRPPTS